MLKQIITIISLQFNSPHLCAPNGNPHKIQDMPVNLGTISKTILFKEAANQNTETS